MLSPLLCSLLTLTIATPGLAPAPTATLSIDDAVARVVDEHPVIIASHHAVASAEATTDSAASAWLPRIDVEAWYRLNGPVPELNLDTGLTLPGQTEPLTIQRDLGTLHNTGATIAVGWRVYDFGARDARTSATEAAVRAASAQGGEQAAELAFAARTAYLASLFFAAVQDTTRRTLDVARASLEDARARQAAGINNALAVAAQQTRIADLSARMSDAVADETKMRASLNLLLGLSQDARLTLTDPLDQLAARAWSRDAAPTSVSQRHPTLARLDAAEDAMLAAKNAADRAALPTLDLFARAGVQYPATFVETDRAGLIYAAGVSLKWRVFDGGALSGRALASAERAAELRALADAARRNLARALSDARSKAAAASGQADASAQRIAAAQTYVDVATSALAAGLGTALDLQNAEALLDQAQLARVKARFDAATADAMRLRALGIAALANPSAGASP
jgi:outer membrane protein